MCLFVSGDCCSFFSKAAFLDAARQARQARLPPCCLPARLAFTMAEQFVPTMPPSWNEAPAKVDADMQAEFFRELETASVKPTTEIWHALSLSQFTPNVAVATACMHNTRM